MTTVRELKEQPVRQHVRERVSEAEWQARTDLAACYRLAHYYRMTDQIYTHISARVPDEPEHFLINAYGLLFDEITASSLVKIDHDGTIIDDPSGLGINEAGFVIHSAIHKARHDVNCVMHTHTRAGVAVSAQKQGLLMISQHAMRFHDCLAYHDYEGVALELDEQQRLTAHLGDRNAMILRNHGLLTCGPTVREAFELMYYLECSCQIQIDALAGGAGAPASRAGRRGEGCRAVRTPQPPSPRTRLARAAPAARSPGRGVSQLINREVSSSARDPRGFVRIFASASAIAEFLPSLVVSFLAKPKHADIDIDLEEMVSRDVVVGVKEGRAAIGVCWAEIDMAGLESIPYKTDRLSVIVPLKHPLASKRQVRFADMLQYDHAGLRPTSAVTALLHRESARVGHRLEHRRSLEKREREHRRCKEPRLTKEKLMRLSADGGGALIDEIGDAEAQHRRESEQKRKGHRYAALGTAHR